MYMATASEQSGNVLHSDYLIKFSELDEAQAVAATFGALAIIDSGALEFLLIQGYASGRDPHYRFANEFFFKVLQKNIARKSLSKLGNVATMVQLRDALPPYLAVRSDQQSETVGRVLVGGVATDIVFDPKFFQLKEQYDLLLDATPGDVLEVSKSALETVLLEEAVLCHTLTSTSALNQ